MARTPSSARPLAEGGFVVAPPGLAFEGVRIPDLDVSARVLDGPDLAVLPGLGLPICKQLVGRMGGEIRIESEEGKGMKGQIFLPPSDPE